MEKKRDVIGDPVSEKKVPKVGKIVPVNLRSGSKSFSCTKAFADCDECCGPYSQCKICNY
jgi:hypothetical protein